MKKLGEGPEADCLEPKEEERALGEDRMSGRGGDENGRGDARRGAGTFG